MAHLHEPVLVGLAPPLARQPQAGTIAIFMSLSSSASTAGSATLHLRLNRSG